MKKTTLSILLCIYMINLYAQNEISILPLAEKVQIFVGIETGISTYNAQSKKYDFIRKETSNYYGSYNSYSTMSYSPFFSLKAEYRLLSDKFWLSTGISYASFKSKMGKFGNSQNQTDYFYILLSQSQNESYYYRIKEIQNVNHYVGIPVDIRYSPFLPRFFRLYFKLGFDFNFKIASKQSVAFYDSELKKYKNAILDLFDKPNSFYSTSTLGVGIQLGKQNKPNFRIEADFPSFVLTPTAFGLMDHNFGGGGSIGFIFPLKSKLK